MALLPIILLFAVMYFLMIRPQQRRMREHQGLVSSLTVGDEVVTAGGIFGTIAGLDEEAVSLEVAPGVTLRVLRPSVTRRVDEAVAGDPYDDSVEPDPDDLATHDLGAGIHDLPVDPAEDPPGSPRDHS